ncbi:hypothetical protein BDBG_18086, partial [Blastomyces gilchristii SLH14081]
ILMFVFIYIESLHIDRSASADNSELNIELLIKNLKNVIMKKLSVSYVIRSFISLSASSATVSQSSTSVSMSGSPAPAISVSVTLTFTTSTLSNFAVSAFIISSLYFKKMLHRLNELYLSRITSLFNSIKII